MPVPTLLTDLSTTIASNSPAGSDNVFPSLDDYLRSLSGFLASIRDNSGNGWVSPYLTAANPTYTGTLTGGTGVVNLGSGQFYKSATGDVGIGTATPAAKLQVVGGQVLLDNGQFYGIKTSGGVNNSVLNLDASDNLLIGAGGATTTAQLWTGGAERARIDSSGNLLVGVTSNPGYRASFSAASGTGLYAQGPTVAAYLANSTSGSETVSFVNSATTGNNAFTSFYTEVTPTQRGSIIYNRAGGLVAYNTTSDYRAKDIIGPVQNVGATIDALKVYEGKMKGATQSRPMLIAHEAQEHAPYAVSGVKDEVNEDGSPKYQQIDVSSLVPLLLAEIQSLRARVAALEA